MTIRTALVLLALGAAMLLVLAMRFARAEDNRRARELEEVERKHQAAVDDALNALRDAWPDRDTGE